MGERTRWQAVASQARAHPQAGWLHVPVLRVQGVKRIATEVDHIIPLSQGGTDDDANLMAIAGYPCHARKTARESAASRK